MDDLSIQHDLSSTIVANAGHLHDINKQSNRQNEADVCSWRHHAAEEEEEEEVTRMDRPQRGAHLM